MKQIVIMTVLLSFSLRLFAAEPAISALIKRKYGKTASFQAQFEQSIYWSVREKTSKHRGTLTVAPGNRFRIELNNETYVGDGTTVWQYSRGTNQVVVRNFAELNPSIHPSRLLTTYLSDYPFKEKTRGNGVVTLIWNGDTSGTQEYRSITVEARESDGIVTSLVLVDKNMNIHTYRFKKTVFGKTPPANTFTFEAPPDATVLDNRQ